MKLVIQRVARAEVIVDGTIISSIKNGIFALVGIGRDETIEDVAWCTKRLTSMKLWPNEDGKPWKSSVSDIGGDILLVSQFTLHAQASGSKLDFHRAGSNAEPVFNAFVDAVRSEYTPEKVCTGMFGAMMQCSLVNDGPVTITLDSRNRKNKDVTPLPAGSDRIDGEPTP